MGNTGIKKLTARQIISLFMLVIPGVAVGTLADFINSETSIPDTNRKNNATPNDACYEGVGCFPMGEPWRSAARPLPSPEAPAAVGTRFFLATRTNRGGMLVQPGANLSTRGTGFEADKPVFVIVHGFASDRFVSWMVDMKNALLEKVDGNVFLADWGPGAAGPVGYLQAAANARVAGAQLGRFLQQLISENGINPQGIHVIGFCLGAHVSSYAGKRIMDLGRITALDPAQPGFEGFESAVRLDAGDATFVDVVHSDARPSTPTLGAGMIAAAGHVDFYINGGFDQPGCVVSANHPTVKSLADFGNISTRTFYDLVYCPHARAAVLYTEAIRNPNCTFWGHPGSKVEAEPEDIASGRALSYLSPSFEECSLRNCAPLGLGAALYPARGSLVVTTQRRMPYCVEEPDVDQKMRAALDEALRSGSARPQGATPTDRAAVAAPGSRNALVAHQPPQCSEE